MQNSSQIMNFDYILIAIDKHSQSQHETKKQKKNNKNNK